jgi:hypothetical protein
MITDESYFDSSAGSLAGTKSTTISGFCLTYLSVDPFYNGRLSKYTAYE